MSQDRLDDNVEVLMAYARHDFSPRLAVSPRLDDIDAIATGINLLAEELDGEVASRRELAAAYERLQAAQAQLVVAEKFAAIGQLSNGVAHELNNPATWVLLGLGAIERRLARVRGLAAASEPLLDELAAIDRALSDTKAGVERMHAVVGDLRTLARADTDAHVPLDFNVVVRAACQLSRPAYHSVAALVLDLGEIPPVLGDRRRLGQLVTNLLVNAAHAVAEHEGAHVITVSTSTSDGLVMLAVEDTGPGIPEPLWERVFEPYFTTKPSEVGTGLGLALVRNIATRHGGSARAVWREGGGARIEVWIPATAAGPVDVHPPQVPPTSPPSPQFPQFPRARILIIDDEPMLLSSLRHAIDEQHDVVTALGGRAALDLLAQDRRFDLIMCDLQMPSVDGVAVHDELASSAPELVSRLVVMSGGAVTPRATSFLQQTQLRWIVKPIELDQLLALVRTAVSA